MKRESFVFYKSFYDSIKELDPSDQVQIYNAIFNYQFENKKIKLNGVCKSIFTLIIPQLEANNKRYENGKKGGRPSSQNETETKPNENQNETETKPNNNQNETKLEPNVNVNVNDNVKEVKNVDERLASYLVPSCEVTGICFEGKSCKRKPTLEEVEEYCKERQNSINATNFIDFYESKDWYIGKNKMKDWKACVRTWEKNSNKYVESKPEWFGKEIKMKKASDEEIKQMEDLLKKY